MLETDPRTWADRIREKGHAEGLKRGREQGLEWERKLLLRQARVRFGRALARSLASLLEAVRDANRLEDIGDWLLVRESGDAFLARLRQP